MYVCEASFLRLEPQLFPTHSPKNLYLWDDYHVKVHGSIKYIVNNLSSYNVRNFEVKYNHVIIFIWFIRFYTILTYNHEFWFGLAQVGSMVSIIECPALGLVKGMYENGCIQRN